jgi:hypothetical protein
MLASWGRAEHWRVFVGSTHMVLPIEGGQTLERRTKKISRKQRCSSARTKSDASIRRKPRRKAERRARLRRLKRGKR